jgi:epoxyqueuosine reductase
MVKSQGIETCLISLRIAGCPISILASAFEHKCLYAKRSAAGSVSNPVPSINSAKPSEASDTGLFADRGLKRQQVHAWALEAGFAEAGLVALPHAEDNRDAERFEAWVAAGRAGTMKYLERVSSGPNGAEGQLVRARAGTPFPWARSAVVCFAGYHSAQPRSTDTAEQDAGWIARYAWTARVDSSRAQRPSDYHKVLLKRIKALEARIREERLHGNSGGFEARGYVDTGPVVERALATAAGLGWTGKNTCLIHPKLGSFGFLAVLLTSLEVEQSSSLPGALTIPDRCGTCRRCLDACPTDALFEPYQMDATKCISYLTIENRGPIAEELMEGMGRQVFGCDICQDVCPWNSARRAPIAADPDLQARPELVNPALEWLAGFDDPDAAEAEFNRRFNGSPIRRAGFNGLRRNVAIAMGNSGLKNFTPWLERWTASADEGLRTAARWALERLSLEK